METTVDRRAPNGSEVAASAQDVAELNHKIDQLSAQVAFLAEEARQGQRRRRDLEELRSDLTPMAFDAYHLAVANLEKVEQYVQIEDILHLAKRLLRNTRNLGQMLDQMESLGELWLTMSPMSQDAFVTVMTRLDEMERKGYFAFMRGGADIMDRVVTSFTEEDVQQLGNNIVLILETVKQMTQPEVMQLLRRTALVAQTEEPADVSLLGLLRQLNDPDVRRGLGKTLTLLKSVSAAPTMSAN